MEPNEFEKEMLQIVLDTFGTQDTLSRSKVLDLFGQDENFAASIVEILVSKGLVAQSGGTPEGRLPNKLIKLPERIDSKDNDGHAERKEPEQDTAKPAWNDEFLLKRNTDLQNEGLRLQRNLRSKEEDIYKLNTELSKSKNWKYAFFTLLGFVLVLLVVLFVLWPHHKK